ncbi:MAG: hypothetical protein IH840_01805 [Candidatus Heimdallarchaeota archaeon]|nr:hypothetical protein [Candidatus Heimdallarchaeota archaeon]
MSQRGTPPSPLIEIFLSTLLNAIDRFVSTFIRKKFIEIKFYIPDDNYSSYHIQSLRDYYDVTFA